MGPEASTNWTRRRLSLAIMLASSQLLGSMAFGAAAILAEAPDPPPWSGREAEIELILGEGEVVWREPIGRGVTNPYRVHLVHRLGEFDAVWKPIRPGYESGYRESWEAEVAAYRLDRRLGLEMVPPTVVRKLGGMKGSMQVWVNGYRMYVELMDDAPRGFDWQRQLARMKLFDNLISNKDRNAGNFLVREDGDVVLIDHSRAFGPARRLDHRPYKLPVIFDRQLIELLEQLDFDSLKTLLGDVTGKTSIKSLLARRDALIEYFGDATVSSHGVIRQIP